MNGSISLFDKTILDSLSAHVAILDKAGVIVETNKAWKNFGTTNQPDSNQDFVGLNYLKVCDASKGEDEEYGHQSAEGIRAVMNGHVEEFVLEYPCHTPTEQMWFYMRATRVDKSDLYRIVVSHENITPIKQAEETIRKREEELEQKTQNLEDANTALKVLLKQHEMDKRDMEDRFVSNVKTFVMTYLEQIKKTNLSSRQLQYIEIIEGHINDMLSPFLQKMSVLKHHLTPQEIKVASFVREGRATKEIADILRVTTNAVDYHRKNIRKKLQLSHKGTNLQSFLMNVTDT